MRRTDRRRGHLLIDLSPMRSSRDLRYLVIGELVTQLGSQLTAVAVPYQVYAVTHSSLDVGLVSLAQLFPLIAGGLFGGSLADAVDRRRLLLVAQLLMALCSAGLAINADTGARLWPLFVLPAVAAGFGTGASAAMSAILPNLVRPSEVASVNSMFQALFQLGGVAGPAAAGLLLVGVGVHFVYWVDVATWGAAIVAAAVISPQRPRAGSRPSGRDRALGLRSIGEGFRYLRGRPVLQGAYLIDLNATVFGLPKAVFPALAADVFGGGASTLGFLYAAPGAGALLGAVTTGWVHAVRRQGRAVIVAVIVWGAAVTCFGLVRSLPIALVLLAVAGWADVVSAILRNTIIQLAAPDNLRGRLMGVQMAAVTAGPRMGDVEAGAVAAAFGAMTSVVSGGLASIAGALVLARLLPAFRHQQAPAAGGPGDGGAADDQR